MKTLKSELAYGVFLFIMMMVSITPSNSALVSNTILSSSGQIKVRMPVLNGFSGTPTSYAALDQIIEAIGRYGFNCYRISFTPSWTTGTRPYNPGMVDYFLQNSDYYIIIDRNHHTSADTVDWAKAEEDIFEVLKRWGNNPRVIIEIVNEYRDSDFYSRTQTIITHIRQAGYNNLIVANRWTQPWTQLTDEKTYQGMHFYFGDGEYSVSGAQWNFIGPNQAFSKGITTLCNTEVGADSRESSYFTADNVARLRQWLDWCDSQGIGNMIWMNKDLNNLNRYLELGLFD